MTSRNLGIQKIMAGAVAAVTAASGTVCHADNPIIQTKYTADPAPMVYKNTVYLYTSHDEDNARGFTMYNWLCYSTTDMANWTDHGIVAGVREPYKTFSWADGYNAWAPQCIQRNGKFYLYVPFPHKGQMVIGVAVSDSPFGPFTDPLGKPLVTGSYDPTVFIDDNGQAYLYWGGNGPCYYVKLNKDMISYSGDVVRVSTKPQNYQEGPWFYKRKGHYYLAYSSTCCPEGIGYAMSTNATGPWTYKGYVMEPNRASSGNQPGIIDFKGKSYCFGFNYALLYQTTNTHFERRSVCVDLMNYNADGTIQTMPWWSTSGPPQIGTLNPYLQTEAATICRETGVKTQNRGGGKTGVYVSANTNGAYIKLKGADFGRRGAAKFLASVASAADDSAIELRLDNETGPLVGTLKVKSTGALDEWEKQSCSVSGAKGIHDLYLQFTGSSEPLMNFDWWKFEKE